MFDAADIARDIPRAGRGLIDLAGDLAVGRTLLRSVDGDRAADIGQFLYQRYDHFDCPNHIGGPDLVGGDLVGDVLDGALVRIADIVGNGEEVVMEGGGNAGQVVRVAYSDQAADDEGQCDNYREPKKQAGGNSEVR